MDQPDNNRNLRRMRAMKGAKVVTDRSAGLAVDCRIVDLTSRGARLRFAGPTPLSEKVTVMIMPEEVQVIAFRRWQRGNEAGVEFDAPLQWLERHDRMLQAS